MKKREQRPSFDAKGGFADADGRRLCRAGVLSSHAAAIARAAASLYVAT
jgi:hypothetical protein